MKMEKGLVIKENNNDKIINVLLIVALTISILSIVLSLSSLDKKVVYVKIPPSTDRGQVSLFIGGDTKPMQDVEGARVGLFIQDRPINATSS